MKNKYFSRNGKRFMRVPKPTAKKLYEEDKKVFMLPHKMNPMNPWTSLVPMTRRKYYDSGDCEIRDFEEYVNSFEYYNCAYNELGRYAAFYIELGEA